MSGWFEQLGAVRLLPAILAIAAGFLIAVVASQKAVRHTSDLAAHSRLPRFVVGFTLLAIGTDLPEIANSLVSSISGHGDLNVGDSVGSAATQMTLVLGALPIIGAAVFQVSRTRLIRVGLAIVGALLLGIALMADGFLSRMDALILVGTWVFGSALIFGPSSVESQGVLPLDRSDRFAKVATVLVSLAIVGVASIVAVWGLTVVADVLSLPEYMVAFFLASVGTSLPELIVEISAVRQQQHELAIGDAVGSSFVDVTLSIGIGPLVAPVAVTASLAITGSLLAAAATVMVVSLLAWRRRHDWRTGTLLVGIYVLFYVVAVLVA